MTRYEIYCTICQRSVTELKDADDLTKTEYKQVLAGANIIYACRNCYWKPFYNTLIVKVGIRPMAKPYPLVKRLDWLEH